jgi:ankyrin repeat protein
MKVGINRINQIPVEILIMIIEKLGITDASNLCQALNIPEDLAYQYHQFYQGEFVSYSKSIYDAKNRKLIRPNLAKAQFKNSRFQSLAYFYTKLIYSILSQDLDLVRYSLQDPRVDHDDRWCSPMNCACEFGQLDVVKLLVNEYGINISARRNSALYNASKEGHIDIVKYIISHPDFNPVKC